MATDTARKITPPMIFEAVFDFVYLLFALGSGIFMVVHSDGGKNGTLLLFGCMALVLGGGDSFHLGPRIVANLTGRMDDFTKALGVGKFVTAITMTVFYVLLYFVWAELYGGNAILLCVIAALALVRIVICLFPQNEWLKRDSSYSWSMYRNLPFTILGVIVLVLFTATSGHQDGFRLMALAIGVSFACYLPVILFAHKKPALGMLMIPKTLAYIWIICMGFSLL
jgi:hypothetical protein